MGGAENNRRVREGEVGREGERESGRGGGGKGKGKKRRLDLWGTNASR